MYVHLNMFCFKKIYFIIESKQHFVFGYTVWLVGFQFPDQGSNPGPSAVSAQRPNHWIAREFPTVSF